MELKLAWLYPDLMELFGDSGNINILKYRCKEIGINLMVNKLSVGETFDLDRYDMVFIGGASDRELGLFYEDMMSKREEIIKAIENNQVFLAISTGYQILGQHYKDGEGNKIDGLGAFNYYTETDTSVEHTAGYLVTEVELDGENLKLAGFENHAGKTYRVLNPFGKVIHGVGNNEKDKSDGIKYKNFIGTYMSGPLLARNPELTDILIKRMCDARGYEVNFPDSINRYELKAKEQVINELEGKK